jgi:hypothetical protein
MNTKQLPVAASPVAARGPVRFLAVAATLVALAAAAPPAQAADHNARVAEYLLQHRDAGQRNGCVAEYFLQHRDAGQRNARVAEYLLQHPNIEH